MCITGGSWSESRTKVANLTSQYYCGNLKYCLNDNKIELDALKLHNKKKELWKFYH